MARLYFEVHCSEERETKAPSRKKTPMLQKFPFFTLGGKGFSATFANSFKKGVCLVAGNLK
jgi:hypothetical protein